VPKEGGVRLDQRGKGKGEIFLGGKKLWVISRGGFE